MNTLKKKFFHHIPICPKNQIQAVNLVLSGGGVKGVAHIALIEFLESNGINIQAISGSSAGALIGALYASGMKPKEMLSFFKSTPLFRYTWLNPIKAGIFDSDRYEQILKRFIKERFEDLRIPLTIAATNLEKGQCSYFQRGGLLRPLLASCAVPAIFTPVNIEGELYSDGGVMDNFPIFPFVNSPISIIGSYVCRPSIQKTKDLNTILKVSNHANSLLLYAANNYKFEQTLHTFVFPLGEFGTFDTKQIDLIYSKAKDFLNSSTFERPIMEPSANESFSWRRAEGSNLSYLPGKLV